MKNLILILLALSLTSPALAAKGNTPCSGKKGGIASCTKNGQFVCKDGSISKSKRICK